MRAWQVIRLVAAGGIVVVLGAAALMLWPLLWPPDPDASVHLVNGRLVGETSGYVGRVDRDARTVEVSSSLVGLRPLALVVNEQTSILVQDRQGGFGDLAKDVPVRVSYEVVGDQRMAKSIEIMTDEDGRGKAAAAGPGMGGPASPTPIVTTPVPAEPPVRPVQPPAVRQPEAVMPPTAVPAPSGQAETSPPASSTKAPVARSVPPPTPAAPTVQSRPPRAPAAITAPSPPASAPARPAAAAAEPSAGIEPVAPKPMPRLETEAPSAVRPAPRPIEPESDGAEAIDWLLKRGQ